MTGFVFSTGFVPAVLLSDWCDVGVAVVGYAAFSPFSLFVLLGLIELAESCNGGTGWQVGSSAGPRDNVEEK